ncbi:hypothetical protein MHYP_G00157040 [Metynnis hypsauchen]
MSRKKGVEGQRQQRQSICGHSGQRERPLDQEQLVPGVQANGVVHPSRPPVSSSSEFYDIAFKVMLVGDSGVGKTCLLVRFKDGAFLAGSFISTVGIDFRGVPLVTGVSAVLVSWVALSDKKETCSPEDAPGKSSAYL